MISHLLEIEEIVGVGQDIEAGDLPELVAVGVVAVTLRLRDAARRLRLAQKTVVQVVDAGRGIGFRARRRYRWS